MTTIWSKLGFSQSPYSTEPLKATAQDLRLFQNRARESARFLSQMSMGSGGIVIVSGNAGIGKTSFVNVQQHLMASGQAGFGPKLLPDLSLTSVIQGDRPADLACRLVQTAVSNIQKYCLEHKRTPPDNVMKIAGWFSHKGTTSGYQITIGLLGYGRNVTLPPVAEATIVTWKDVMETIAHETSGLGVDGLVCCIDNAETLNKQELTALMMNFRDTLFSIQGVWWIVIGQAGLHGYIDAVDRRVSQRISGQGIEIPAFDREEFNQLVRKRVTVFGNIATATTPLSQGIHSLLFEASCGEVRFVFHTADALIKDIIAFVYEKATESIARSAAPNEIDYAVTKGIRHLLVNGQINDDFARERLKLMARAAFGGLGLDGNRVRFIKSVGRVTVTPALFKRFGYPSSSKFVEDLLEPLYHLNVLSRDNAAEAAIYRLKGFARLCLEFGDLGSFS